MNIKPGVCGICGVAVVQPDSEGPGWHSGHLFEPRLKPNQTKLTELILVKVRCMSHQDREDPRYYDREGNIREDRWPDEVIC